MSDGQLPLTFDSIIDEGIPDEKLIPASYWRISLGPAYRGASQERLDALLAECRRAEREQ